MLNVRDNFNENVEYCMYIYRTCFNNFMQLSFRDVQDIANKYVFELDSMGIDVDEEVVENEEVLNKVLEEFFYPKKENDEFSEVEYEQQERLAYLKNKYEKLANSYGGHGFVDSYDDESLENINEEISLRLERK